MRLYQKLFLTAKHAKLAAKSNPYILGLYDLNVSRVLGMATFAVNGFHLLRQPLVHFTSFADSFV